MDDKLGIKFLTIAQYHRNQEKSEKYTISIAREIGLKIPKSKKDYKNDVLSNSGVVVNISEQIRKTRVTGVPFEMQFMLDSGDRYLAPAMSMSFAGSVKGMSMKMQSSIGSFNLEAVSPCTMESPEQSLAEDILFYRKKVVENSEFENWPDSIRYYRAYLHCCISLVDTFLFRYVFFINENIKNPNQYENCKTLCSVAGLEKRIEAWFDTFAVNKIDEFKKTKQWSQFCELRKERNKFVHPSAPIIAYTPSEMVKFLNLTNSGIGGLLVLLREYSLSDPKIGFIQRILTAPKVTKTRDI